MKAQRPFFLIYLLYGMPVLDKKLWCIQQRGCFFSRNFSTRVSCNLSCIHASFYRSHKAHGWYDGLSCNDAATSGPFDYCHYATKYFYYVAMKSQKIHPCLQFFWWRRCRWSKVRSKLRNKADRSQMVSFIPTPKWRSRVMSEQYKYIDFCDWKVKLLILWTSYILHFV